jgi:hypothetical protein
MRGQLIAAIPGHNRVEQYFGASPSIILVRPHGYAAFTGSDNSAAKLAKFCDTWLVPQTSSGKVEDVHE